MKYSGDIVLSGEKLNPEMLMNKYGLHFRNTCKAGDYNERRKSYELFGYGILSLPEEKITYKESDIYLLLKQYEKLVEEGERKLGIEKKTLFLYFECLQSNVTVSSKLFCEINKFFDEVELVFLQEEEQ